MGAGGGLGRKIAAGATGSIRVASVFKLTRSSDGFRMPGPDAGGRAAGAPGVRRNSTPQLEEPTAALPQCAHCRDWHPARPNSAKCRCTQAAATGPASVAPPTPGPGFHHPSPPFSVGKPVCGSHESEIEDLNSFRRGPRQLIRVGRSHASCHGQIEKLPLRPCPAAV